PIWRACVDARRQTNLRRHLPGAYGPGCGTRELWRSRRGGTRVGERTRAVGVVRGESSEREENAREEFQELRLTDLSDAGVQAVGPSLISSTHTLKPTSVLGPNAVLIATSVAS